MNVFDQEALARTEQQYEARHYDETSRPYQDEPLSDWDRESWARYLNARRVADEADVLTVARTVGVLKGEAA